ncbi:beta transducin-like protein HET-D2Y [Eremomyces bilateralis CBS 781.70]|uniref:Beta transducin-like protein HET-D2Y n=1 Tax=Eremomyces bilateralis CBS 781.70 TaxID=1392243 RepID=A0A6G1FYK3_9PEZI|nr:beta transducin-like protein HET-D2Y [Eremomyces bilateralis CBS 781.70]KAF1810848.1 beta transducin-like protein HET-D2Y [Eremomyces bilateralis CBS 781.70]
MRLLQREKSRVRLTKDLVGDDPIPPYAILSHTWGADTEEVTFEDVTNGTGEKKLGYEKIRFCRDQTRQDGLQYFWIDTCCIDKTNHGELSRAINSMFQWYRKATRCYVYLSDVSTRKRKLCEDSRDSWEPDFRKSRWFTRGWTLQELLVPASIEFFSREGKRLGDGNSLKQQTYEITGIPQSALQGGPLSQFSVEERFSWIQSRQTKLKEDRAYSLLGIFGVYISPRYGEGMKSAFKRLQEEIDKLEKCIQDLRLTDPRHDKKRIEATKGGLLEDSYRWILDNSDFQQWRNDQSSRLLWIKGDPGKGKTMLLCGIIDELNICIAKSDLLSYFFCQATDSRINNATAVLRGLIYLLIDQQPSLISHVREKYDHAGKTLFEDANAWVVLSEIFTNILHDRSLTTTYLVVDALDECVEGLPKLLDFIVQMSSTSPRIKWIISSRNWPSIEENLDAATQKVRLCLELNEKSVAAAITTFIQFKVDMLAERKRYSDDTRDDVHHYLSLNAKGTFLWVALVCQELANASEWEAEEMALAFPPGLDLLYKRMLDQIYSSRYAKLCKSILAIVLTVRRPITLDELVCFVNMLNRVAGKYEALSEIIGLCGSFLNIREHTIYLVHQSAKDFLAHKQRNEIHPSGIEDTHRTIFSQSLQVMSKTLRRDVYGLGAPGLPIDQVKQPDPDPLSSVRYSSIYWIDHLLDCAPTKNATNDLQDGGSINIFLRQRYLYWLEALSLCRSMSEGVVSMAKLEDLIQRNADESGLLKLVKDARRFIMSHKLAIETSPLQAYASALLFSPARSLIRGLFKHEEPNGITIQPAISDEWSACLQTLEGHSDRVISVVFSRDSTRLASASYDKTVKIWDPSSGACLQTLKGHSGWVGSVVFSSDSTRLASASRDTTVKIWDANSGACLQTLKGHSDSVSSVVFLRDSSRIASASSDKTVKIWDASSGACLQTLEGHSDRVSSVTFSCNSTALASASEDKTVNIWDPSSGACLQTLEGHSGRISEVAFSRDSTRLASASFDKSVKIWDASSGVCLQTLKGHSNRVSSVAFSCNSTALASASYDKTVKIWDPSSGACLQTLKGHSGPVYSVVFSRDSTRLASASYDETVKIWDPSSGACLQTLEGHSDWVRSVAFSLDSTRLASASDDETVKIWDASSGACLQTLEGHGERVMSVVVSRDSTRLASASDDKTVKIWDASSGVCLQTLKGHSNGVSSVAFSCNSTALASASYDKTVKIWDASSGACLQTFEGHSELVRSVAFSLDSTRLASASDDETVKIWDISSGVCLQTLKGHIGWVMSVVFSSDSTRLASASMDTTVKIWDANSGACLQTLEVEKSLHNVLFDATSSLLQTDIGTIAIDPSSASFTNAIETHPQGLQYKGVGLSSTGVWITYDSENILWLPSEYRPSCSSVSAKTVGIGVGSGKNYFFRIQVLGPTVVASSPRRWSAGEPSTLVIPRDGCTATLYR